MFDLLLAVLVVALVGLEIWWGHRRLAVARVLTSLVLFIMLFGTADLGPAARRALERPQRIEVGPEGYKELAPEYASGVLVMKREAERVLHGTIVPAAALALLAMVPVFRSWRKGQADGADATRVKADER